MRLFTIFRIAMAACAFCTGAARAADQATNQAGLTALTATAAPIEPYTNERETQTFVVNADGSYTKVDEMTLRVNNEAGVARVAQYYIWFNRNMASVDILEAYTTSADGTRHDVRPEQIRDVQEARSFDAPMFQDILEKVIVFPAVEPGARVHLKYRKTQMQPIVPGHFSDFTPPDLAPTHNFRLVYDLPAGKPLYADARGFVALPPSTKDGRTRYEFRYDKAHFARLEYGSIAYVSYGDRLMVSTYPDYAAFAAKYRESAVDASGSDPAIVGLARSLTAGDQTPRAKARTLYDWVRKNVRYVAVNIGRGAVVPHRATEILALRYGDCKDHVALYGALLDAVGIRNEPALISSGTIYTLPDVPGYGVLNHVITWLPELQLYADSTAPNVEFGYLPSTDMNRPVVLVNEGVLSRTPSTATMSRTTDLSINVAHDGTASFVYRLDSTGWAAEQGRALLRMQTPAQREESLQAELRFVNLSGTATLSTSNLTATDGPLSLTMKGKLEDFVVPGTAASIPALTSFVGGFQSDARYWLGERQRTQPFVCRNVELHERTQIALPANFRVLDMPEAMTARDRFVDYRSSYSYDANANVITVTRDGATRFGSEVCSPEDFTQMRAGIETIGRDVRAQVIVRSTLADVARGASSTLSVPSRVIAGSPARAQSAD
jgi:transglutaminase-like putative cysteine protease